MTILFEELSDKTLNQSKLVKKLYTLMREYNRCRQRLHEHVSEQEIANLYKLLSHFDIVLHCVCESFPDNPEVQKLQFQYRSQISQEWYALYHYYLNYTCEPEYSIEELICFARQANQSYLPRALVDNKSPIHDKCDHLHVLLDRLSEVKKMRRKKETTKVILEELAIREAISDELLLLLKDPQVYSRYEKELFRTLNQQSLVIIKILNKFIEQTKSEYVQRAEDEALLTRIVNQLVLIQASDTILIQQENFSQSLQEIFSDYQVTCLNCESQTTKVSKFILRPVVLPVEYVENAVGYSCFDALAKCQAKNLTGLLAKPLAQILLDKNNENYLFVEISAAYPYDLMSYLPRLKKRNESDDENLTILMYAKKIMEHLLELNQHNVYYNNIKPSNLLIDQWGNIYLSQMKSLVYSRGEAQLQPQQLINHVLDNDSSSALNLDQYQKLSLGLCLYQLSNHTAASINIEDMNFEARKYKTPAGKKLHRLITQLVYPEQHDKSLLAIKNHLEKYIDKRLEVVYQANKKQAINDGQYGNQYQDNQHLQVQPPLPPLANDKHKRSRKKK